MWASIDWWSIARSGISTAGGMLLAWWLIWRSEKAAGKEKAARQGGPSDYTGKHNQGEHTSW